MNSVYGPYSLNNNYSEPKPHSTKKPTLSNVAITYTVKLCL